MDSAVKVEGVSKKYCRALKHTMIYGATDLTKSFLGLNQKTGKLRNGEFWAVDEISFEVQKGEVFGIVGPNGSGKSTILKLLNGIFMPDKGRIRIQGRVGALIEVGAGFHPLLTGRENVYINASILGMKKKEIDARFDEIVDFADIGDFIDAPVKHYSSGMFVRLGFAVAVHCAPEILLVDEILSVGDAAFRIKSMNKMLDIVNSGATVCFVSHDLMGVEHICKRVLWLQEGRIKLMGDKGFVLEEYMKSQREKSVNDMMKQEGGRRTAYSETNLIWVTKCELLDRDSSARTELGYRDKVVVRIHYKTIEPIEKPYFMIYILDFKGTCLFHANMLADGSEPDVLNGEGWLDIDFGRPDLYPGSYMVSVQIRRDSTTEHYFLRTVAKFKVVASPEEYGYKGKFKSVYSYSSGIAQPYEYRWGGQGA